MSIDVESNSMIHKFEENFFSICREIITENKTDKEWAEIESENMFQEGAYEGGFDALEMQFCFSLIHNDIEYWFQLSLEEIYNVLDGTKKEIEVRVAE